MAYVLQNRFIDLHSEVEELNVQLEEKINERTMELFFSEIGIKLYSDLCSELNHDMGSGGRTALKKMAEIGRPPIDKISRIYRSSRISTAS